MPLRFLRDSVNVSSISNDELNTAIKELIEDIHEELLFDTAISHHKLAKLGIYEYYDTIDDEVLQDMKPESLPWTDKKATLSTMILCPNCRKKQAATRLSSHLSKCLGFGRNSSRQASRRIAQMSIEEDFVDEDFEGYGSNEEDSSGGTGEADSLGSTCSPEGPLNVNEEDEDTDEMEAGDAEIEDDDDLDEDWEASSSASSYTSGLNGVL